MWRVLLKKPGCAAIVVHRGRDERTALAVYESVRIEVLDGSETRGDCTLTHNGAHMARTDAEWRFSRLGDEWP